MDKDGYTTSPDALRAEYERGFVEGMSHQAKSSVDRAVNAMSKREWQGLTDEERIALWGMRSDGPSNSEIRGFARAVEAKLKEKNT
jgi:hypothetical protein